MTDDDELAEIAARLELETIATFAVELDVARAMWRKHRYLVEVKQMPRRYVVAHEEVYGEKPAGALTDAFFELDWEAMRDKEARRLLAARRTAAERIPGRRGKRNEDHV